MKLTGPLRRVLQVFLADVSARHYGYDLMKAAGLASGTLYPLLGRLQEQGLVTSEWEPQSASAGGRPPRRYYQLTGEGARAARLELAGVTGPARTRGERRAARPAPGTAR
ncbi:MAG TPA: PadR family transcriptional regulator [Streptosporangiaceae bacterium]